MSNRNGYELIEKIFREEYDGMKRFAIRNGVSEDLAHDIVQKVFEDGLRKADSLAVHINPVGWMYKAVLYAVKKERKKSYRNDIQFSALEVELEARVDTYFNSSIEPYFPKWMKEKDKELLLLAIEEEWDYSQLAEYYGIKEATCRKRFSRIIEALRKEMNIK